LAQQNYRPMAALALTLPLPGLSRPQTAGRVTSESGGRWRGGAACASDHTSLSAPWFASTIAAPPVGLTKPRGSLSRFALRRFAGRRAGWRSNSAPAPSTGRCEDGFGNGIDLHQCRRRGTADVGFAFLVERKIPADDRARQLRRISATSPISPNRQVIGAV